MLEVITKIIWYIIGLLFLSVVSFLLWDISDKLEENNKISSNIYKQLKGIK